MNSINLPKSILFALYINAAILLAILLTLVGRGHPGVEPAYAQALPEQPPIAGGNGIFVMPCQLHPEVWGCYVIDTQRQSLAVYEYRSADKSLYLSAARNFRFDLDLKNYNTFPAWYDIQKAVKEAAGNDRVNESQLPPVIQQPADNNSNP
jgi:hypothetical protein